MAVSQKRPKWAQQILQNVKEHEAPHGVDGIIEKYKAVFVARGFSQKERVNYDEKFAPMARYTSIRSIIAITSAMGWKLYQMDAKTTFLKDIVHMLLLDIRSMVKAEEYFPKTRYTKEIRNVGLQVHSYSNGCKFEEAERFCFRFKFDRSHYVSLVD